MKKEAEEATQETNQNNLVILPTPVESVESSEDDYKNRINMILGALGADIARGVEVNLDDMVFQFVETKRTVANLKLKNFLVEQGILSARAFDAKLIKYARNQELNEKLGFVPTDCMDFVERYAEREKVELTAKEIIKRRPRVTWHGLVIDDTNKDTSKETQVIFRIGTGDESIDEFQRELRIVRDKLGLEYRDTSIDDAVRTWADKQRTEAQIALGLEIAYEKGIATGPKTEAAWQMIEDACFDVTDTTPGFTIKVLQKFIWQVKRKFQSLPVTNHLMPVIVGPQGKGKSTFINYFTNPIKDSRRDVNFKMITDERIIDIWKYHVLFLDEMSGASKADAEETKNAITSSALTRRPMKSNRTIQVPQKSTLIGCSNKSLAQLIRDDTGLRRFAEIPWKTNPDWSIFQDGVINWTHLWQSVDENGEDPMSGQALEMLKQQQESNRNQTPVEMWARNEGRGFKNATVARDVYSNYREWEKAHFPNYNTNLQSFGIQMTTLMKNADDFNWMKKSSNQGVKYWYGGN